MSKNQRIQTPDYEVLSAEQRLFMSKYITLPQRVIEKLNEYRIYKKNSTTLTLRYSVEKTFGGKTWSPTYLLCEWWMRNDGGQASVEAAQWCKNIPHEDLEEFNRVFSYNLEIKPIMTPEESLEEINSQIKALTERAEKLKRPRSDDDLAKEDEKDIEKKVKL